MTSTNTEDVVVGKLAALSLIAERYAKAEQRAGRKSPDFRVYQDGKLAFLCEVKERQDSDPLEAHLAEVAPGISRASQLGDPRSPVNRLVR